MERRNEIKLFGYSVYTSKPFYVVIAAAVSLWMLVGLFLMTYSDNFSERGQIGDMFNVFTSIMSGLTFAGLVYTILLQHQQINQQREEIRVTKEMLAISHEDLATTKQELVISNKTFLEQNRTLQQQRFESTFFSLVETTEQTISNSQTIRDEEGFGYTGRKAIQELYFQFRRIDGLILSHEDDVLAEKWARKVVKNSSALIYVRSMYILISFVSKSDVDDKEKKLYYDIIKSQMSPAEIVFLFYHTQFYDQDYKDQEQKDNHYHIVFNLRKALIEGNFVSEIDRALLIKDSHLSMFAQMKAT